MSQLIKFINLNTLMGASLVYLDRPNTKKETLSGVFQPTQTQIGYRYSCSAMQGWRLNMVSFLRSKNLRRKVTIIGIMNLLIAHFQQYYKNTNLSFSKYRKMHILPTQTLSLMQDFSLFLMVMVDLSAQSFVRSSSRPS